jgi:hypothetical protein
MLVRMLVSQTSPHRTAEVERLEVFARCGCGKCPTIMFQPISDETKGSGRVIADYQGGDQGSGLIGVMLWERNGGISELEAWSIDGKDVCDWPPLDSIRPLECSR